ncbi:hypothetical protein M404DRAFT_1003230, partial [Pisolithus tinctorius Marx 270]
HYLNTTPFSPNFHLQSATWPLEHTPCLSNTPLKAQTSNQKTTEIISRQANK